MNSLIILVVLLPSQFHAPGRRIGYAAGFYDPSSVAYGGDFGGMISRPPEERVILSSAQFMMDLNEIRAARGLRPVDYMLSLETAAMSNNTQQVATDRAGHYTSPVPGRSQCVAHAPDWKAARDQWLKSDSNRRILLDPAAVRIGVASYRYYWTLEVEMSRDLGVTAEHPHPRAKHGDSGGSPGMRRPFRLDPRASHGDPRASHGDPGASHGDPGDKPPGDKPPGDEAPPRVRVVTIEPPPRLPGEHAELLPPGRPAE